MNRHSVVRQPSSAAAPGLSRRSVAEAVAAVVAFLAISIVGQAAAPPRAVDRIAFVNPTAYDLSIDVTSGGRAGWMPVIIASRHGATAARDVVDQGETWIFRFAAQGEDGGELAVSRRALERSHWVVRIPPAVLHRLEANGATPPP